MQRMQAGGHYTVYIDASYVTNGIEARTVNYTRGSNGDIWTRIFVELDRIGSLNAVKVKPHVTNNEQWEKYNMTAESLCYNVGADRVASTIANKSFARAADVRASDGKQWWETYRAAIRIATIEASIRRSTEAVRHRGSDFAKLEISREEGVKRKLEEAISSTTHEHRVY
jgi:hypothetical protein